MICFGNRLFEVCVVYFSERIGHGDREIVDFDNIKIRSCSAQVSSSPLVEHYASSSSCGNVCMYLSH